MYNYFLTLYPFGHLGLLPLTFLVVLPLTQTIVFLLTIGTTGLVIVPVNIIVAVVATGARVELPPCVAVITQFPALSRFRVVPATEQDSADVVEYVIAPPLDAVAVRARVLPAISTVAGGVNVMVCGSLLTSNETL